LAGGGETTSRARAVAGQNFFETHLVPIHDVGTIDGNTEIFTHTVQSSPVWDANVLKVPTHLGLDGEVKLMNDAAFVILDMTGTLGGPALNIFLKISAPVGGGCPCSNIINSDVFGDQAPKNMSEQKLVVTIFGRARYDIDASPVFQGAVPEPSTWILSSLGVVLLSTRKYFSKRRG
jgi:hypothetical protein